MRKVKLILFGLFVALALYAGFQIFFYVQNPPVRLPTRDGRTMPQWLQLLRSNTNSTENPLTIARIVKNKKWETIECEVPLSYDILTNYDFLERYGGLRLMINGREISTHCEPARNGYCILSCDSDGVVFGTNHVQATLFILPDKAVDHLDIVLYTIGPVTELVSSNACYITAHFTTFDESTQKAVLRAHVSVQDASYDIDVLGINGNHVKTISGITTNGFIDERWDLIGDDGERCSFDAFHTVFHIACINHSKQTTNRIQSLQ